MINSNFSNASSEIRRLQERDRRNRKSLLPPKINSINNSASIARSIAAYASDCGRRADWRIEIVRLQSWSDASGVRGCSVTSDAVLSLQLVARSVSNFLCYRLDKSAKISGLFCWDVYIIFFLLLQNLIFYFQNGGQKTKMAAKKRKTNITGLIIDLQSRVICQNVHCLNRYLIWLQHAILIISIWPKFPKWPPKTVKQTQLGL